MRNQGLFILIEGHTCSGKTTTARELVDRLCEAGVDAYYNKTPNPDLTSRSSLPDENTALSRDLLYLNEIEKDAGRIEECIAEGKVIVQDRFMPSFEAYTRMYIDSADQDQVFEKINEIRQDSITPNLCFYLKADQDARAERMQIKPDVSEHDMLTLTDERLGDYMLESIKTYCQYKVIDTSNLTPSEVVGQMLLSIIS